MKRFGLLIATSVFIAVTCLPLFTAQAMAATSKQVRLYPQRVVELSTSDQGLIPPSTSDALSRIDAARPSAPSWTVRAGNYRQANAWVAAKFRFDTKAILACAAPGNITIRQGGSYKTTAPSTNVGSTGSTDARQILATPNKTFEELTMTGGRAPGSTKAVNLTGRKVAVSQTNLANMSVTAAVQAKDQNRQLDWTIDNIWLDVEYRNTCTSTANRYRTPVFQAIDEFTDVTYRQTTLDNGQPISLKMDIFKPAGDTLKYRPTIVFIHGGGYQWGTKEDINYAARWYAKAGYTTASIDYRLMTNTNQPGLDSFVRAFNDSVIDTKDAVRFLSANSTTYGVDTNAIATIGWSAGGATSLGMQLARTAYTADSQLNSLSPMTHAIVAGSGSLGDPLFTEIQAKKPEVLMINWEHDTASGPDDAGQVDDLARATCAAFNVKTKCTLVLKPGSGHDIDFVAESKTITPLLVSQLKL